MRKTLFALLLLLALPALAQNVPIYTNQGATELHIGNGGTLYVDTGGTLSTGSGTLITQSANLTLDDGSGASPNFTLQDATNETIVFSKVDAGYCTATTTADDGLNILVGNLKIGNGTPGLTINGEDFYCEGISEFDNLATFDGGVTVTGAAVNLNASSNYAVNVATGTSTGAVTIGSATTTQAVTIQSGTGDVAITSTDDMSITATDAITISAASRGTAGTGVAATTKLGSIQQDTVTFTLTGANDIDVADGGKSKGVLVYTFPEGRILLLGAVIDASVVTNNVYNASTNDVYYVSVGSVDGTQAADADLTSTEADIIPKTTLDTVSNTTLTLPWKAAMGTLAYANNIFDGTTTAETIFLNVAVPDASNTGATTHAVTGTLKLTYVNLGDY